MKRKTFGLTALMGVLLIHNQLLGLEIAKYAGEFLSTGVGARGLGMGSAYVAVEGDASCGYWNPAGLAGVNYPEIMAMHSRRFGGVVNYDYAGFATPFKQTSSIGVTFMRLAVDDIPITALPRPNLPIDAPYTDEQGQTLRNRPYAEKTVNWADYAFLLNYARQQTNRWSFGGNVKFLYRGDGDHTAWGIGFDVGALFNPVAELQIGANIQNITTTILAWNTGRRELISPSVKTGVSYPIHIEPLKSRFLIAADTDIYFEGRETAAQTHYGNTSLDFHVGGELLVRNIVALRIGNDLGNFAAGAGIHLPRLELDYAFLSHDEFETTHRVSVRIRFEEKSLIRR